MFLSSMAAEALGKTPVLRGGGPILESGKHLVNHSDPGCRVRGRMGRTENAGSAPLPVPLKRGMHGIQRSAVLLLYGAVPPLSVAGRRPNPVCPYYQGAGGNRPIPVGCQGKAAPQFSVRRPALEQARGALRKPFENSRAYWNIPTMVFSRVTATWTACLKRCMIFFVPFSGDKRAFLLQFG